MSIILGALGSVIGYLGAEAATESFFERLLWPERFYNDIHLSALLRLALFLTMAGPLHGAALQSLDTFRENGLYLGIRRGNMLGTTFLHDTGTKYYHLKGPTSIHRSDPKETRNGFWVQVLRQVKCQNRPSRLPIPAPDDQAIARAPPYRAMQLVHHLKLNYASNASSANGIVVQVTEANVTFRTVLGTVLSECSSIAIAITAAFAKPFQTYWVAFYLLVPLALKFFALLVSVRRDSILDDTDHTEGGRECEHELYEIDDPSHGFAIVQGPQSVVLQFWRHYGHPKRDSGINGRRDRAKELLSMGLIYLFVLYFPAGLIGSLWMPQNTQLLWLGFQVYTILAMHVVRIVGWDSCGRTEARVARYLELGRRVWLRRPDGLGIVASLETTDVPNVAMAREEINAIIHGHFGNPPGTSTLSLVPDQKGNVSEKEQRSDVSG